MDKNIQIEKFDELIEISKSALIHRLDESSFHRFNKERIQNNILMARESKTFLKRFLIGFKFLRIMRSNHNYKRFHLDNNYTDACAYSDALIADFNSHVEEYLESYELLSDDLSRKYFINLLAGEMLLDCRFGVHFQKPKISKNEYYITDLPGTEPFFGESEILVDCGMYTGDTLQEFICEGKKPQKYFGFEPDSNNFKIAQKNLLDSGVEGNVYNACVYSSDTTLRFSCDGGCGTINQEGELLVKALSLDSVINEPTTLIKMDIEGSEYEALEGAALNIKKYKPKLAICIYHKPTDYRKIPLLIKRLNSDYSQFYIRYHCLRYSSAVGFPEVILFVR